MTAILAADQLLRQVETARHRQRAGAGDDHKANLGQYLTPRETAMRMAGMFRLSRDNVRVLDPGAGVGALSAALVVTLCSRDQRPRRIDLTAVELDESLIPDLSANLEACRVLCTESGIDFVSTIRRCDFVKDFFVDVNTDLFSGPTINPVFDAVITNPPYKKIRSSSPERVKLGTCGVSVTNLYAAFVALAVRLLDSDGELVAITPRSWCNGTYFQDFRRDLFSLVSLDRIHIYGSRVAAFADESVLTENIIFQLSRRPQVREVVVSESDSPTTPDTATVTAPIDTVVSPHDASKVVHIATTNEAQGLADAMRRLPSSLSDLGIAVSTGRVVDFRAERWLLRSPEQGAFPLIHPLNFNGSTVVWPKEHSKKAQALDADCPDDLLIPAGHYTLVKRFSSKEERRRIVACVYEPQASECDRVGIENHLNYFHKGGATLDRDIAFGLARYLNTVQVDSFFRQWSGHTQVNATDLRALRYPSIEVLRLAGAHVVDGSFFSDERFFE